MSYARFGDESDVYVFATHYGEEPALECCGCLLGDWSHFDTQSMIDHLAAHREAGHAVPAGIEDELREDDEENFVTYARCDVEGCERIPNRGSPMMDGSYASTCSVKHERQLGTSVADARSGMVTTDTTYTTPEAMQARLVELDAEYQARVEKWIATANTQAHGND